jgi:hypothetical protein
MNKLVILFVVVSIFCSCKKEKDDINYTIEGTITDINDNSPIESAKLTISKREVSSGTFNSSYSKISELTTTNNGLYSIITEYGSVESFKFELSHLDYFSKEIIVNPDDLSTEITNEYNFELTSKGYIKINIKNNSPYDILDQISFNSINSSCTNCVKFNSIELNGTTVDTILEGGIEANKYYKYQYFVTKNGVTNTYLDSVFCTIGDTTFTPLLY